MRTPSAPVLVKSPADSQTLHRIPRSHRKFMEKHLQELLVEHPALLPVDQLRSDVGELLCIGREVSCDAGSIDNLYLSTGGYPVIVETKLWRSSQARREVLAQVLDYTKDLVTRDFRWFEQQWRNFRSGRNGDAETLVAAIDDIADDEIDEAAFTDRVHRALASGDILSLIVGDGIETRLQQLVSHLCRDSAHLRYSIGLVELACYTIDDEADDGPLLFVPRLVQSIDPVERAYVRIELGDGLPETVKVKSIAETTETVTTGSRPILTEETFRNALDSAVGPDFRQKIELFYTPLLEDPGLEPEVKGAAMMLKLPDPNEEKNGASMFGIERAGRIYNSRHMLRQLQRWGLSPRVASKLAGAFWASLHDIDPRFAIDGIHHLSTTQFIPLKELEGKFDDIVIAVRTAATAMLAASNQAEDQDVDVD